MAQRKLSDEKLLEAVQEAQTKFWNLLGRLEEQLGLTDVESTVDLSEHDVDSLKEEYGDDD